MRRSPWPQSQLPSFLTSNSLGELNPQPACLQLRQQLGAPSLCLTSPPSHGSARGPCPDPLSLCCLPDCGVLAFSVSQARPFSASSRPARSYYTSQEPGSFLLPFTSPWSPKWLLAWVILSNKVVTLLTRPSFMCRAEYSQLTFAFHSQRQRTYLYSAEKFFTGTFRV